MRFGLRICSLLSKAVSVGKDFICEKMSHLLFIVSTHALGNIWNADEFNPFYRQPPRWTLSQKPISGSKKQKARITFLASSNDEGFERMLLAIIGNSKMLHPFEGKTGKKLSFDFYFNMKAWVSKEVVFAWPSRSDQYVICVSGCKTIL